MFSWRRKPRCVPGPASVAEAIRARYHSFRELITLNNECLEVMAGLQEDLQFVTPRRDVLEARVGAIFDRAGGIVGALEALSGLRQPILREAVNSQRHDVERYLAACQELATPRFAAWLSEVGSAHADEVGGKAAALGEIKSKLGLPVPDGYVLTTEAYRHFCGTPLWTAIRDAVRNFDPDDVAALQRISAGLTERVLALPVPRAVEVAIAERALALDRAGLGLAVRSSAVGEGGAKTYAGQFVSLINVPPGQAVDAYKQVVAGRFSERALSYRLSAGLIEVDSPMAVLVLPVIRARASGVLYTRNPGDPKSSEMWITATRGLGLEVASGRMPADLFVVSRKRHHQVIERHIVPKREELVVQAGGGLAHRPLSSASAEEPSLDPAALRQLAEFALRIENHFTAPQDIEWAQDAGAKIWILQTRPLALADADRGKGRRVYEEPLVSGGRAIYPGQVSGPAFLAEETPDLAHTPPGAILFVRRASPEIVRVFPRIAGLVAEGSNVAGHAAALLREFKIPSVFMMSGALDRIQPGIPVSLDAVAARVYSGMHWPPQKRETAITEHYRSRGVDPIGKRLLALNLLDPAAGNFRPSGCKSTHDVLRYCHEKAIEAMFAVSDVMREQGAHSSKHLLTELPLNVHVLDLGGGLAPADPNARQVAPGEIVSRPFQALWKGLSHPGVQWTRDLPASLSDFASVMARSLTSQSDVMRALGDASYLLVADEYLNLNSRLAYHFSLVDACLSDVTGRNYISFRFEGGGASGYRRSLRACFIEACLTRYGFVADRRGDLVNAWFRKGTAAETEDKLDILGRLMACSSQLDMYMTSFEKMRWYVRQFLDGNYALR